MAENAFEAAVREFKTTTRGQFIWRLEEVFKVIQKLTAEEVVIIYHQIPGIGKDFPGIAGLWFTERTRKAVIARMKCLLNECYLPSARNALHKKFLSVVGIELIGARNRR